MSNNEVVWTLPYPSQEIVEGPELLTKPGLARLRFDTEDGGMRELRFQGVLALQFMEFSACEPEQLEAYDKLIQVGNSEWLERVRDASREDASDVKHYRIFFDEVGCYDVLARKFEG